MIIDKKTVERLKLAVKDVLRKEGLELVEFKIFYNHGRFTIRSIVDYPEGGVTIDTCARVNRLVFSFLEKENVLGEDFVVEVHSPGINRILKERKDFLRVKGRNVLVWLEKPIRERNFWEGKVVAVEENSLALQCEENIVDIPFSFIKCGRQRV